MTKQEIEDSGWIWKEGVPKGWNTYLNLTRGFTKYLGHHEASDLIVINDGEYIEDTKVFFEGKLDNKEDLKRLMKQIGI